MHRILLLAAGAAALGCTSAHAMPCPAYPPPVVKFVPLPSDVQRDISKTAKELGATRLTADPLPASYERDLAGSTERAVTVQRLQDGTVCAALQEIDFKLGYQRKIYIAKEFAADSCVADTVADFEMPLVKSDDSALAQFGATIPQAFAAAVNAIGTHAAHTQDDAQKPFAEKISGLLSDKIYPAFEQQVDAAAAKVDMGKWQRASCNGATDKAFASIGAKPNVLTDSRPPQISTMTQPGMAHSAAH